MPSTPSLSSLDVGGVGVLLRAAVAGPVPNRLRGQPEAGHHCPAASERAAGSEWPGQHRVRLAAALRRLSNAIYTLLRCGQLCMANI